MPDLPQTAVSPVILNNLEEPTGGLPLLKDELDFFSYLEDATSIPPEEESFVDDMCGQRVPQWTPKTDVCVTERSPTTGLRYLLLVLSVCRRLADMQHFLSTTCLRMTQNNENNKVLLMAGLPTLPSKAFAGITGRDRADLLQDTCDRRTSCVCLATSHFFL